jgi:prepilin-type N-terminal cleavage/methylation domain-containing protein
MRSEQGFTLIELMTTLAVIAILGGAATWNMRQMNDPLLNASFSTEHFLRLARSRAISNTQTVTIAPSSNSRISASQSDSCSGTMTNIPDLFLDLPSGATLVDTAWSICFTQRGLVDTTAEFQLVDREGSMKTVHVALGGGAKVD